MSRYLLAFDTSGDDVLVAIARSCGEMIFACTIPARRLANTVLLTAIDRALQVADITKRDIEAIVIGCGPGSFTGVRIGVATAKGLAQGLGIPLFGVSTTDAILWGMWQEGKRGNRDFALDAMRREIYPVSAILTDQGVERARGDYVAPREEAAIAEDVARFVPVGLIQAFLRNRLSSSTGLVGDVLPIYTRLSDAEETEREKAGQPTGAQLMAEGKMSLSGVDEPSHEAHQRYTRRLTFRDIEMLHKFESEAFGASHHPWTIEMLKEEFAQGNRLWLGMFSADGLIGYIGYSIADGVADLLRLGVCPTHRRIGVARSLLDESMAILRGWNVERVLLEVREINEEAIALYASYGFEQIAIREKYFLFTDGPQDALVMEYTLDAEKPDDENNSDVSLVLGIETSCDETAAAVLEGPEIKSNIIASQIEWHARFGGVVPEIASRKHIEAIAGVVDEALEVAQIDMRNIDAIAVTQKPGLVGALVVGLAYAKGLSYATGIPLYGINHLEGHIVANKLVEPDLEPPFVSLIVSGGNTSLVLCEKWGVYQTLGETLDDATGEAFDKVAKVLGLGYPGGPAISRLAEEGNPDAIDFPRAMMHTKDYRFSLSGLKTAVITYINQQQKQGIELNLPDIAASFQQAIIDVQVHKAVRAVKEHDVKWFCLAGGVAANKALRDALTEAMTDIGVRVSVPPFALCGDNAAMIAATVVFCDDEILPLGLDAEASANASFV